ncbi:MAG: efflux RND transporter periplasmic adaptor subunit [Chloroflexi bacterium]|nr:efflux RND transporter periplasmic adaptor subunit [Chloroflexota bacterium]
MSKRFLIVGGVLVLIVGGLLFSGAGGSANPLAPKATPTAILALSETDTIVSASGTLLPAKRANLAFKIGGQVVQASLKTGDKVKKGDTLIKLDSAELEANVASAQTGVDSAKAQLTKVRAGATKEDVTIAKANLDRATSALRDAQAAYDKVKGNEFVGMMPQSRTLEAAYQDFTTAQARLDQVLKGASADDVKIAEISVSAAETRLNQARIVLASTLLVAPIDGTIVDVKIREGEFVSPGVPVVVLGDLSTLQIETDDLSETNIANVQVGQPVKITFEAIPGKIFNGKIAQIAPIATAKSGGTNFTVTVTLDALDPILRWGMTGHVEISTKQ